MSRYVWDIEADNLLKNVTKVWCHVFKDIDSKEVIKLRPGENRWIEILSNAKLIVGHNILSYDFSVLEKLYGFKRKSDLVVHDTLIMSLVLNYNRFPGGRHSLENWGKLLGYPKIEFNDFSKFSEEMLTYCVGDVELNLRVYTTLLEDFRRQSEKNPLLKVYLRVEHAVAEWCAKAELYGWPFDKKAAEEIFKKMAAEMKEAEEAITPILGMKTVAVDKEKGVVPSKKPKWIKNGDYAAHTADWFKIPAFLGQDPDNFEKDELSEEERKQFRPILGEYSRVEFRPLKLSSTDDVKLFLFRNGWVPTEFNWKRDPETGSMIKMSPKITEEDLEGLEGHGKLYSNYVSTKSRYSILETWLEELDSENKLHGSCFTIGTPSMRARHSIIVNVPSVEAPWGKEMRSLFITQPGWVLVGADSAGNQARGLAHYLKSEQYIDLLLNGDVHSFNAEKATEVLKAMGFSKVVERSQAKRILYAFLFGASGKKLWSYIFGAMDEKKGAKFKKGFTSAVPGFEALLKKLDNIYGKTKQYGDGYIPGIGGNRIFVDSFHKLLVYLLQSCEKATCGAATMLAMQRLESEGIPYRPCIFMHDEIQFAVPEEHAVRAAEIAKEAFKEGPKLFGIEIMDGESKIGRSWYETH